VRAGTIAITITIAITFGITRISKFSFEANTEDASISAWKR